jgi:hypothetical protein
LPRQSISVRWRNWSSSATDQGPLSWVHRREIIEVATQHRAAASLKAARNPPNRSIPPEVLEPIRRQLGVAHRVLDVLVAKVCLQRPGVVAGICEGEAAGVPKHVGMRLVRPARRVAAATMRAKPAVVNGPPRSLVYTTAIF